MLRCFYESSPRAMGVMELTEDDAHFVSANTTLSNIFGYAPGKLEGLTASEIEAPAEVLRLWIDKFRECRATGPADPVRVPERLAEWYNMGRRDDRRDGDARIRSRALLVHPRRHHQDQESRERVPRGQGGGGGRQPGQRPIPRRAEPRAPDPDDARTDRRVVDAGVETRSGARRRCSK